MKTSPATPHDAVAPRCRSLATHYDSRLSTRPRRRLKMMYPPLTRKGRSARVFLNATPAPSPAVCDKIEIVQLTRRSV